MEQFEDKPEAELETFIGIGGQLRYRCPDCPYDSYKETLVLAHWLSTHDVRSQGGINPPTMPTLYDAEDKPVKVSVLLPDAFKKLL